MATQTTPYPAVQGGSFLSEDRRPDAHPRPEGCRELRDALY